MHTSRLCDHPRITANTDGGQTEGLFYLSGPIDYLAKAAEPQLDERERAAAWIAGTLSGEDEIIFSMERVAELAMAEGPGEEILTLMGPARAHQDRYDDSARVWFEGQTEAVETTQIQVQREQLRQLWLWTVQDDVISALEDYVNKAHGDTTLDAIHVLNDIRTRLSGVAT